MTYKETKLVAWGDGDRTMGEGTFTAEIRADGIHPDMVSDLKQELTEVFSKYWDIQTRYVHVMTAEELSWPSTRKQKEKEQVDKNALTQRLNRAKLKKV